MKNCIFLSIAFLLFLPSCSRVVRNVPSAPAPSEHRAVDSNPGNGGTEILLGGYLVRNNPLAQWSGIFISAGTTYGVGKTPDGLTEIVDECMDRGHYVEINGTLKTDEMGPPAGTVHLSRVTIMKEGVTADLPEGKTASFTNDAKITIDGKCYDWSLSSLGTTVTPGEIMSYIRNNSEVRLKGGFILDGTRAVLTSIEENG